MKLKLKVLRSREDRTPLLAAVLDELDKGLSPKQVIAVLGGKLSQEDDVLIMDMRLKQLFKRVSVEKKPIGRTHGNEA